MSAMSHAAGSTASWDLWSSWCPVCAASRRDFWYLLPDEQSLPGWNEGAVLGFQLQQEGSVSCCSIHSSTHILHSGRGDGVGLCTGPELGEGAAQPLCREVQPWAGEPWTRVFNRPQSSLLECLGHVWHGAVLWHVPSAMGTGGTAPGVTASLCSWSRSLGNLLTAEPCTTGSLTVPCEHLSNTALVLYFSAMPIYFWAIRMDWLAPGTRKQFTGSTQMGPSRPLRPG